MGVVGMLRATMQNGIIRGLLCTVKHWIWSSTAKTVCISLARAHLAIWKSYYFSHLCYRAIDKKTLQLCSLCSICGYKLLFQLNFFNGITLLFC